jgi:hypothetical protein
MSILDPPRYLADFARFAATEAQRERCATAAALIAAVLVLVAVSLTGTASAATAQQTIAELNAERAANGIPAGITENPAWSDDCAEHDNYMAVNHTLTHTEDPTKPGYTKGGAFAGENAVLIEGASWDTGDPYESAPLHLDWLLAPRLAVTGSADADGYSCTITFPGLTRPDPPALTVYTDPGDGTTTTPSEVAREQPFTPGDLVGLPQPAVTGPYLTVLVDAPGQSTTDNPASLSDATVTGPRGPVQVKTVDGNTPVPDGASQTLAAYIPPGGFIIPVSPLLAATTYHAHVAVTFAGAVTQYSWTFTTLGADPQSALTVHGDELAFTSLSPQPIRVTLTRANGGHAPGFKLAPRHHITLQLGPGSWEACGHQAATSAFAAYAHCVEILVTGIPSLHFGSPRVLGTRVLFPIRYTRVLRRRHATLTVTPLSWQCNANGSTCRTKRGKPSSRVILMPAKSVSLPLPAIDQGFQVTLATAAFQLADAPWTAAHAASAPFVRM